MCSGMDRWHGRSSERIGISALWPLQYGRKAHDRTVGDRVPSPGYQFYSRIDCIGLITGIAGLKLLAAQLPRAAHKLRIG
jgi:hypothetical protein